VLFATVVVFATACGGTSDAPAQGDVDVPTLLDEAADAMAGLESARFTMERSGASIEIAGLEFVAAEGQYAAPANARAILQVRVGDLSVEMGTIAIGDLVWLTNPLTGGWEEIPEGTGFNIAVIFDPTVGWVPLLTQDLSDISYEGTDGEGHRIHGIIAASRVEFLTAGLVAAQAVEADIWIDPDTSHITKVAFETTLDGAVSEWTIQMSQFDEPVVIEAPAIP
jgi:lipoprotein LprG